MGERDELEDEGIPDLGSGQSDEQLETGDPVEGMIPPSERPVDPGSTTAEGQRRGRSLDERLAEESRYGERRSSDEPGQVVGPSGDLVDEEDELIGMDLGGQDENAPEDRAVHVRDDVPGGVDAPDDDGEPEG
ncbi:MAG TPA: hypothetical protein VIE12_02005 [Actinomycetota bacterium]|jgi:hypothetical protein